MPRHLATNRIARQAERFPDLALEAELPEDQSLKRMAPRDAALAYAIEHAVLRRWLTLAAILQTRLTKPLADLEPRMQATLLTGCAQLMLFERLPDYAVINDAVEYAKRNIRRNASGMVNAVLRRIAELRVEILPGYDVESRNQVPLSDGRALLLRADVFDASPIHHLAQATSHPVALLQHWQTFLSPGELTQLALHNLIQPPIILTHPAPAPPSPLLVAHEQAGFHVFTGSHAELVTFLRDHPAARVQDPAAARAVTLTASLSPRLILDACAGRGTKTRQLLEQHPAAQVIASDADATRLAVLQREFASQPRVAVLPPQHLREHAGKVDLLVLDVPCSNTAVLARRVEARYRFSRQSLADLGALQQSIVNATMPLLARNAHILYSTCSIEPQENADQARWLAATHRAVVIKEHSALPVAAPGDPPTIYADGGYAALLKRA